MTSLEWLAAAALMTALFWMPYVLERMAARSLRGDYRRALVKLHESRDLYEEIYGPTGTGRALLGMGEVYYLLGDLDRAFAYYEEVLGG